jgi:predicted RNA-binding protein Jag
MRPPPPTVPIVADVPLAAVSQAEPALPRATPARPRAEGRDGGGRGTDGGGRSRGGARGERSGGRGRGGRRRSSGDDRPELRTVAVERSSTPAPEQGPQSDMAKVVRVWCEEVLDLVRLDVAVRTEENETQILVRLYGRDAGRMVERHGELLDAVQVLANKALTGRKVEKEIELDCEAFKERRTETLEQQARELAERVRRDGREQLLPAMSPVERRIIHLALQDDADVATESRGDGFFKRVAVIPRPASPAAES